MASKSKTTRLAARSSSHEKPTRKKNSSKKSSTEQHRAPSLPSTIRSSKRERNPPERLGFEPTPQTLSVADRPRNRTKRGRKNLDPSVDEPTDPNNSYSHQEEPIADESRSAGDPNKHIIEDQLPSDISTERLLSIEDTFSDYDLADQLLISRGYDPFWYHYEQEGSMADVNSQQAQTLQVKEPNRGSKKTVVNVGEENFGLLLKMRNCDVDDRPIDQKFKEKFVPKDLRSLFPDDDDQEEIKWQMGRAQCSYTHECLTQHELMYGAYDFPSQRLESSFFCHTVETPWMGVAPISRDSIPEMFVQPTSQILAHPKPDLVVGFKKHKFFDEKEDLYPELRLKRWEAFFIPEKRRDQDPGRAFPFLLMEAKGLGANYNEEKALQQLVNGSSWALHGMWRFFENEKNIKDFYEHIRVFTISCHAKFFKLRVHRAKPRVNHEQPHQSGFLNYEFSVLFDTENVLLHPYTKKAVQTLIRNVLKYAEKTMYPHLRKAVKNKLKRVKEGKIGPDSLRDTWPALWRKPSSKRPSAAVSEVGLSPRPNQRPRMQAGTNGASASVTNSFNARLNNLSTSDHVR